MKKHAKNTCPDCGKEIASKASFSKHLASHLASQTAICSLCGLKVPTKLMQTHQKTHEEQQSYTCSVCHLMYTQKQMLARHLKSTHGLDQMPIETTPPMVDITQETDDSLWNLW